MAVRVVLFTKSEKLYGDLIVVGNKFGRKMLATQTQGKIARSRGYETQTGRKRIDELYDWPWKLSIDLYPSQTQKICFMSGKEREYFPEHPGYSRHGVEYSMNCHPGDTPNPSYTPSENRLDKPISLLGYGIGGLSAPRFPEKKRATTNLCKSIVDNTVHPQIKTIIQSDAAPNKQATKNSKKSFSLPPKDSQELCRQNKIAFNSNKRTSKFSKTESSGVGVGHYDTDTKNLCKRVAVLRSFGSSPASVLETTKTFCNYEGFDKCIDCHELLTTTDYYRSIRPISIPHNYYHLFSNHSELNTPYTTTAVSTRSKSIVTLTISSKQIVDLRAAKMCPKKPIAICRSCYCSILQKGHDFWDKDKLVKEFQKTRHCVNIHEHENVPFFIRKVPCKLTQRLKRLEALMNKNFRDSCEKVVREVK